MGLGALFLGLPIFGCATFALWWFTNRQSRRGRGVWSGLAAVFLIPPLALGFWWYAGALLTEATYVCLDCGRTERQERFLFLPCSSTVLADGEDYVQRFRLGVKTDHSHLWHLESCKYSPLGVACTEECIGGWFRVLPKLADHTAADELFREAQGLPYERRCALMDEITSAVELGAAFGHVSLDEAFRTWRTKSHR